MPAEPANWHSLTIEETLAKTGSTSRGLTSDEAEAAVERFGKNKLPEPRSHGPFIRFLLQFHNILIYTLLISAAVTFLLGHHTDTLVILAVVLANALIGMVQEGRAENAMSAIRKILAPKATVLRDGQRKEIKGEDAVPGDIVLLEAGDQVPADLRLIRTHGISVQEALLTGESVPADKDTRPVREDAPLGDRSCMAFSGTMVTRGQAAGVVVATGKLTEIGRISRLLSDVEPLKTPLLIQMDVFAKWLTFLILMLSAALFLYGDLLLHMNREELFLSVVALSVAAIPEGLPAVLTITLAIGVQAMAKRNAIIRRLPAIETLGSVSVICTDKTGTLTQNQMIAVSVCVPGAEYSVGGAGYEPAGAVWNETCQTAVTAPDKDIQLTRLARAAALCNDARLIEGQEGWMVSGDPMEGALLALSAKICGSPASHESWSRSSLLPFDARHRYMATHNHCCKTDEGIVLIKGAPERILGLCKAELNSTGQHTSFDAVRWHSIAEGLAARGQRVLAFAERSAEGITAPLHADHIKTGLTFLGLAGLQDPPRPESVAAVAECRDAGIQVKMITGDHAGTASAIGRSVGLLNPETVLTGADLDQLDSAQLRKAVLETNIFARTSPEHKLRLVEALQAEGMTVAMTGDGVNDAPALKRADAGIAMGQKGSEAAKQAADVVLADDNFRSIAEAVREGRVVYDNITKVIGWTLPTSTGEAMTIAAALIAGIAPPVTAVQILWVNLITAATLGIALAFEPGEPGTMKRQPRPRSAPVLTGQLVWHITFVSVLFLAAVFGIYAFAQSRGLPIEEARTIAVNTLVVLEIAQLFFIRTSAHKGLSWRRFAGSKPLWGAIAIVLAGQALITYLPAAQAVFGTSAISLPDITMILGAGVALFGVLELERWLRHRWRRI